MKKAPEPFSQEWLRRFAALDLEFRSALRRVIFSKEG